MKSKSEQNVSDFLKQMRTVIDSEFGSIEYGNEKAIVITVMDETNHAYHFLKGSKQNVTLAVCELFQTISNLKKEYVCEKFAAMLDTESARFIYNAIEERDDFSAIHENDDDDIEDDDNDDYD